MKREQGLPTTSHAHLVSPSGLASMPWEVEGYASLSASRLRIHHTIGAGFLMSHTSMYGLKLSKTFCYRYTAEPIPSEMVR